MTAMERDSGNPKKSNPPPGGPPNPADIQGKNCAHHPGLDSCMVFGGEGPERQGEEPADHKG